MHRNELKAAENAIKQIAAGEGKTIEYVREQIRIAMLNGLCSTDPQVKAYWDNIPCEGEYPTPEELIAYAAGIIRKSEKCSVRNR